LDWRFRGCWTKSRGLRCEKAEGCAFGIVDVDGVLTGTLL
jgi:hypothetical protein